MSFYQAKDIAPDERLIVALDVATVAEAEALAESLGESVRFYKLGLELLMGGGYFMLLKKLKNLGKRIFIDLKFFDVPRTVGAAVRQLEQWEVDFATVHGNDAMMRAAADNSEKIKILAVTALTSLDDGDLRDLGFACHVEELVLSRAKRALQAGCSGIIASALELERLRQNIDHSLLVVTPGIRPVSNDEAPATAQDDQKRIASVRSAFAAGADHIVIGRPIVKAENPLIAARAIQSDIKQFFARKES